MVGEFINIRSPRWILVDLLDCVCMVLLKSICRDILESFFVKLLYGFVEKHFQGFFGKYLYGFVEKHFQGCKERLQPRTDPQPASVKTTSYLGCSSTQEACAMSCCIGRFVLFVWLLFAFAATIFCLAR